jgi:hypothetical protein
MSHWKSFGFALFAAVCLLGEGIGSAHAECDLSAACATEWSGGGIINLGQGTAYSINGASQAAGFSVVGGVEVATEWSSASVINLGGLPGSTQSFAYGINDAGQVVGSSQIGGVLGPNKSAGCSGLTMRPNGAVVTSPT